MSTFLEPQMFLLPEIFSTKKNKALLSLSITSEYEDIGLTRYLILQQMRYTFCAQLTCAEGFKEGEGVVGVRTQWYMASFWPEN